MEKLQELQRELEQVKAAIEGLEMSDDFCYTNGRMDALAAKKYDLLEQIRAEKARQQEQVKPAHSYWKSLLTGAVYEMPADWMPGEGCIGWELTHGPVDGAQG